MATARKIREATIVAPGMVRVPVDVYGTVRGATTQGTKTYNLHKGCNHPINQIRVCTKCGEINLQVTDLVKGVKESKNVYVPVDFDAAPEPTIDSDEIEIIKFSVTDLSNLRVKDSYWLAPVSGKTAEKGYTSLIDTMLELGVFGFGHAALWRSKEFPVIVEQWGRALVLRRLHHNEDMIQPGDIGLEPHTLPVPSARDRDAARRYVNAFTDTVDPIEITTEARQWREKQIADQVLVPAMELRDAENEPVTDVLAQMRASTKLAKQKRPQPKAKKVAVK